MKRTKNILFEIFFISVVSALMGCSPGEQVTKADGGIRDVRELDSVVIRTGNPPENEDHQY